MRKIIILIFGFFMISNGYAQMQKSGKIPENAFWDENVKMWSVYNRENHKLIYYYNNGNKHSVGGVIENKYKDGMLNCNKNGEWNYYYEDGNLRSIVHYVDGILNGEFISYHENGKINTKGYYKNDLNDEKWTYWDDKGEKVRDETYKDGKLFNFYNYKIVNLKIQKPLNIPEGAKFDHKVNKWGYIDSNSNDYYRWYINGEKFSEGKWINNKLNGKFTYWNEKGNKEAEGEYIDNQENGLWIFWNNDGLLIEKRVFKNGKLITRNVVSEPNRPNGIPIWANWDKEKNKWYYHDKNKNIYTWYYKNGIKDKEGSVLDNGLRTGKWIEWYSNGVVKMEGNYINGNKDGLWKIFDENGELGYEILFNNGDVINQRDLRNK